MDDICTIILFQILLAQAERLFLAINNHQGNVCPLPHRSTVEKAGILSSSPEQNSTTLTWRPCFLFLPCPASFRKYLAPSQQVSQSSAVTIHQFSSVLHHLQSRSMLDVGMKPHEKISVQSQNQSQCYIPNTCWKHIEAAEIILLFVILGQLFMQLE